MMPLTLTEEKRQSFIAGLYEGQLYDKLTSTEAIELAKVRYPMQVKAAFAEHLKCCSWDTDGDGNCAIHSRPGVLRPEYQSCSDDYQARRLWKTRNWMRNYSNETRRRFKAGEAIRAGQIVYVDDVGIWNPNDFYDTINRMTRIMQQTTSSRYSLDELWPYGKFVKPITELATRHLKNIVAQFEDGERFVYNSDGRLRNTEESNELKRRVTNVQRELEKREKADVIERNVNIKRRIMDTKIQIQTLRDRHNQFHNLPGADEYQNMLRHVQNLLIDIQLEFNLY
jgi:hypothetical protein